MMNDRKRSSNDSLIQAAQNGNHQRVEELIITGADVNISDVGDSKPVLIKAAEMDHVECLKLLLHAGADANSVDKHGKTALMHPGENGAESCVEVLVLAGADVNTSTSEGYTALMLAAAKGNAKTVNALVNAGAVVNKTDYKMRSALMRAVSQSNYKCTELLIQAGADLNKGDHIDRTALIHAAKKGQHKSVHVLLQAKADVNRTDNLNRSPLVYSAWYGHDKCTDLLIKAVFEKSILASRNAFVKALVYSAWFGHEKCMDLLIKAGADVNRPSGNLGTALTMAVNNGHDKCATTLVNSGANVNDPGLLRLAITKGLVTFTEILIYAGADVNAISNVGTTVLFDAIESHQNKCAKLLLSAGVHVNRTNVNGDNVLAHHIKNSRSIDERLAMLLFAAGEFLDDTTLGILDSKQDLSTPVREILAPTEMKMDLHSICRISIRMHLLEIDPHENLFRRVFQLGLPTVMMEYLLFGMSLDV